MNKSTWNTTRRENLEFLLKEGMKHKEILERMGISRPTLKEELKRGLSSEDYSKGYYIKYSPVMAIRSAVIECIGEDGLKILLELEQSDVSGTK